MSRISISIKFNYPMGFFQSPTTDENNKVRIVNQVISRSGSGGATWSWRDPFQIFTTVLLSLLLPLSFLLLARLSAAHYLFSVFPNSHLIRTTTSLQPQPSTAIVSFFFLYGGKSIILYALVSLVSVAAFVRGLTAARVTIVSPSITHLPDQVAICGRRPSGLYVAWALLCTFQVCVGLGIEGSISANIDGSGFGRKSNFLIRALLLVGLHEIMVFWSKSVVKPVVEDTVGVAKSSSLFVKEERRWMVERVGMALSLGALWWWRVREEVDSLVVVPELMIAGGIRDAGLVVEFVGWWLYYLTVSMGTMRSLKGVIWMGMRMASVACKSSAQENSKENDPSPSDLVVSHHHRPRPPTLEDMV